MKKIITSCFVFMFLLAVVAGCPQKSGETKPSGNTPAAEEFPGDDTNGSMISSDEFTESS